MIKLDLKDLKELKQYDLFVVDFDGTIVDTMEMWRYICPIFLKYQNVETNDDVLSIVSSLTSKEISNVLKERYFPYKALEEVSTDFLEFIKKEYVNQKIKPKAIEFLKKLNEIGNVVLYSATALYLLESLIDVCNLRPYFKEIYSGSDLGLTKRDGTGYLEVIKIFGGCDKPLILEDAPHAIIGASSQNLDVLVVSDYSNINHQDIVEQYGKYFIEL